jgi:homoserine kinase
MTFRRRIVRVPASSANLGPGFDVMAAALALHLELEVCESDGFSVDAGGQDVPSDRSNLCVRAFETLHSADGIRFEIRSGIPLARGMGSSAAAIVSGLVAADHLFELALAKEEIYEHAVRLEGHPDNVAAALYGGFVVCPAPTSADDAPAPGTAEAGQAAGVGDLATLAGGGQPPPRGGIAAPVRLTPPEGLEAVLVIPHDEVRTADARAALPKEVPAVDAIANVAAATQLALGIERSDLTLIRRGLADRLHQPYRAHLYERSMGLVGRAQELGALGATISGAGPTVLVWSYWQATGKVVSALEREAEGWAEVRRVPFTPQGADVPEL